jgi:hypothetical protein
MEASTRTEELEGAHVPAPADVALTGEPVTEPVSGVRDGSTARGACAGEGASTQVRSLVAPIREQCSACGAPMASDQRYCVQCGHRRGPARVPQLDAIAQHGREAPASGGRPTRPRMSANSTLIAGIGTLLLALGVGVLIGRSGGGSSAKAPPAQVVTVAAGGAAGTGSTGAASTQPAASAAKSSARSSSSKAAVKAAAKKAGPPPKVVTVGSPGKGPGYQHGHFTGNFFGPEAEK